MFHDTERTRTYPCTACGGELEFHIGRQELVCPHCASGQAIVEGVDGVVEQQDYRQALATLRTNRRTDAGPQLSGEKEVACQNCGGHTTFTGTLTSTRCPFCATPIQRDDVHDAPARLTVDGVVPFIVDEKTARASVDTWVKKRWFAPNEFKKYNRKGAFSSVYMAYFSYDAETTSDYRGRRGDHYTVTTGSGDNRRTETKVRWSHRSGRVTNSFEDITVFANDGLNRRHVAALEPWHPERAQPYSAEYVAGHLCRTYDRDVEQSFGEAERKIDSEIRSTVRRDIGGDQQDIQSVRTHYDSLTFKHLLLPLWLLTVIFDQRTFQVMVNGVTGEVKGARPWSKVKIAAAVIAILVAIVVVLVLQAGGGGT